eukprot:gnl/MRDRNA2_/MRDRNA2_77708_c0_seq1.p1 gnl/MRDRNA2_/MRDRNA2_77708_c0~~gnl/MRDRNA2_/MRDRNA2_77708_c0_seq1.p1  ORF type:complete len:353 (-),score=63.51 gnl/MRDRNA2_/MRDRNA2_77708_c0_seq1:284-1342(-)
MCSTPIVFLIAFVACARASQPVENHTLDVEDTVEEKQETGRDDLLLAPQEEPWWKRMVRLAMMEIEAEATDATDAGEEVLMKLEKRRVNIRGSEQDVVLYRSWLAHQRIHDDMRFANERFLQYDIPDTRPVIVEQQASLGKGGLSWDAAFVLAEQVLHEAKAATAEGHRPVIVELGCGVGLPGLVLATADSLGADVFCTDRGEIVSLCMRNIELNHDSLQSTQPKSSISASELFWGRESTKEWRKAYLGSRQVDLLIGADIFAPEVYDDDALVNTLAALACEITTVIVVVKERLGAKKCETFYAQLQKLFAEVVVEEPKESAIKHPEHLFKIVRARGLTSDATAIAELHGNS